MRDEHSAGEPGVRQVLDGIHVALQPIIEIATGRVHVVEALARFRHAPELAVEQVLAQAHAAGYGYAVEAACLRAALARRGELPDGVRLAINLSPDVLHHPLVVQTWHGDLGQVIVEVTEHVASDPEALRHQLAHLRRHGAAIAVDDVGTGYAGLLRLATMRPDFVKIDRTVVTGVRNSAAQRAVLEALVTFSHRLGAAVIGEGVETLDDLAALAAYDADYAQGWAVARPAPTLEPISALVVETCLQARAGVLQRRAGLGASATAAQGMHAVTSALTEVTGLGQLHEATVAAAAEIEVDVIGISILGADGALHEIVSSELVPLDVGAYALADYPATRTVLQTGVAVEVHVSDPDADRAELSLLQRLGHASLLMIPLLVEDRPVGVLELAHRTHRRWTTQDIAHARGLAKHVEHALVRIQS